jgi:predicted nuclease of predicted toxin-antitoxin system
VKVLLDENFPLGLVSVLQGDGLEVDHIITLGWRGVSDARIRQRLADGGLVFLTLDDDLLSGSQIQRDR